MPETWKNVTIKLIKKYVEKEHKVSSKVIFKDTWDDNLEVLIPEKSIVFTVIKGKSWNETKKYIDCIFEDLPKSNDRQECGICCESSNQFIACAQCRVRKCCLKCTVDIIRSNSGLLICPFCNRSVGMRLPPSRVDRLVDAMMSRAMMVC